MTIDHFEYQDRHGIDINISSYSYANHWLHEFKKDLPEPKVNFWYKEPGLWLPLSCVFVLVVSTSAVSVASNAITTSAINTSGASLLVATVNGFNSINPIGNPSDSKANTWFNLTTHVCSGGISSGYIAYAKNPIVGSGHTFTFGAVATYPCICVAAFSGADLTAPFDQENGADNVSATTGQPGSITPTINDALIIACAQYFDATTVGSVDSGLTLQENQASDGTVTHVGGSLAYGIQIPPPFAVNPTFTAAAGGPRQWLAIASFKPSTAVAATVKQLAALGVG